MGLRVGYMVPMVAPLGVAFALVSTSAAAAVAYAQVAPAEHEVSLLPNGTDSYSVTVTLPEMAAEERPLDVLFVFDATSSMGEVLDAAAVDAVRIVEAITATNHRSAFAVASFGDYSDGNVFGLGQDFTSDAEKVRSAIASIRRRDGGDPPEAYARALYEASLLNWRGGDALRLLVLFGDALAHDPDPGRDGRFKTYDDLSYAAVVEDLAHRGIAVLAMPNAAARPEVVRMFRYTAETTGGLIKPIGSSEEVAEAIIEAVVSRARLAAPALATTSEYGSWLGIGSPLSDGTDEGRFAFPVRVTVPEGTAPGDYDIVLCAAQDSLGAIGTSRLRVRVTSASEVAVLPATASPPPSDPVFHAVEKPSWRWLGIPLLVGGILGALALLRRRTSRLPNIELYEGNGQHWVLARRVACFLAVVGAVGYGLHLLW